MTEEGPLICAFRLDGTGGGTPLEWRQFDVALEEGQFLWIHLRRTDAAAQDWLRTESGLDPLVVDSLLAEETRPRCSEYDGGLILNLRGVNLNPGADPEDMLAMRLWVSQDRIVSARNLKIMAVDDIRQAVARGAGPKTPGVFLADLASGLLARMGPVIANFDDSVDALEDAVITAESAALRSDLADVRRQAIVVRRYIAPQRDALARLVTADVPFITARERNRLREVYEGVTRIVENIDELRERAAVIQDELATRLTDLMNRKLYVLSVVAAIFLPLNLIAGIMGMNVAGMPGLEDPRAFFAVCGVLVVLGVLGYWLLKRLKWI